MSGIYIPGIEMPRKTRIVSIILSGDGSALLCEDGVYSDIAVVPVPDHGRLIDADAFERRCMFDPEIEDMQDVIYALRDYPTIIPASREGEG